MAKRGPDEALLLIGGYDLGGQSMAMPFSKEQQIEETTVFGLTFDTWGDVGVGSGEISLEGFYDDADNASSEALSSNLGTSRIGVYGVAGNVQGQAVSGVNVIEASFARGAARGELQKVAAVFPTTGDIEEGVIIQPLIAESGSGVTSVGSHDFGASGTRLAGYLEVTELTLGGYTSITVKIQESSDDGAGDAFADKVTFTNITAESIGERIAIGVSVERHVRVTLTLNGSGSGESITLLVAITS